MGYLTGWRGRRVLITGGTGFIGRRLVQLAVAQGLEVHCAARSPGILHDCSFHSLDLEDTAQAASVVDAVQPAAILHLAAAGVTSRQQGLECLLRVNVLGLHRVLEAAQRLEPRPVTVVAGSGFEYAPKSRPLRESDPAAPADAYGVSKIAGLAVARFHAVSLSLTWLRLFSVYGPGEPATRLFPYILECAREGRPAELTRGEQVRDFVYVDDAAEAFLRSIARPPLGGSLRVLNVGTGEGVTLNHGARALAGVLADRALAPQLVFGARAYRPNEPMMYVADLRRLASELRWTPMTSLEDGLRKTVEDTLGDLGTRPLDPS